ncbi:P-loop containing nucleoside triphosphate hydrolase protein [Cucurbitaria berberidis CBS 394.84]|uniref:P-loop containing nucleoside triphosphate hydrolase protein n=1 Tax=Cucurbitaria berberidis CBS 394.84 TaxID=1168544 RepID=A0A9P4GQB8_9PLEO|nr:P-loop containing nucleoside triphosphate hydrolase protein [Cucurbitaria berberidis CBS 394.84]KAF1849765.1 P-loop containing nucleoside triphosphate hydrolase protein [Cucurbitaria berberidis CBS 394.84]
MEEQVNRLANKIWDKYQDVSASKRILIAVSGIPGSGKTTLAAIVSTRLNQKHAQRSPGTANSSPLSAFIPMDGYHLSRAQLDAMPDPDSAHARRGAVFTFDGDSFLSLVKKLRQPICPETHTLYAPSFDHAIKDPVQNDIAIAPSVRVVIFEGNYCSLNKKPWKDAAELMDELWFVDVDFDVARKRLIYRHVQSGIAKDEEEAAKRADVNDLVNGQEIVDNRLEVHELIKSNEDAQWAPENQGVGDGKDGEMKQEMASLV